MPRGPKKDPNRPRGKMSAYAFFLQEERESVRRGNPNATVNFQEFSRKCADKWRAMTDAVKNRYLRMAEQDKVRFTKEMANYKPPPGFGKKRKRAKKDPNAPKRALSGFFFYCKDERPKLKVQHPDWRVGQMAKEMSERWNRAPQKVKDKFEKLAQADKARYEREITIWRATNK